MSFVEKVVLHISEGLLLEVPPCQCCTYLLTVSVFAQDFVEMAELVSELKKRLAELE